MALYESLAGVIYHDTGEGEYSRSGRFFNFFKTPETKRKKNAIVTGVASNTFFEKIPEGVLQIKGVILIISGVVMMFFRTFF